MSKKLNENLSLATKLTKVTRVQQLRLKGEKKISDIEDAATGVCSTSPYFSPVQTRRQRICNANPLKQRMLAEKTSPTKEQNAIRFEKESGIENKAIKLTSDVSAEGSKMSWEPPFWQQVLTQVREMRANTVAPVDTMGCHKCSDDVADEKTQRFQKLVALMLSSQTKDQTTFEAMQRLKAFGLTPSSIVSAQQVELEDILRPVSFYKNKAKYLQQTSRVLLNSYAGDIPNTVKGLEALPGVGPKMAHICMATAWNEVTGIGVDVHVHRIANRLRWVPKETKEPEQTRLALEAWLPRELWREVNYLLVGFGQTICTPVRPHCGECLNKDVCPAANMSNVQNKKTENAKAQNTTATKSKRQRKNKDLE